MRLLALLLTLALATPAAAYLDDDPVTDYSAYTLRQGELRLGLFRLGVGILDELQIESWTLPWFIVAANARLKGTVWQNEDWAVSAGAGVLYFDPANLPRSESESVPIFAVPLEVFGTYRTSAWGFNLGLRFTHISADASDLEDSELEGVGVFSTAQLVPAVEWRLTRSFALVLDAHLMLFQLVTADAQTTTQLDERTTLDLYGEADVDLSTEPRANAVLSALWSWESFHLRVGLGYGHWNVPIAEVFTNEPIVIPEIDLYWRF